MLAATRIYSLIEYAVCQELFLASQNSCLVMLLQLGLALIVLTHISVLKGATGVSLVDSTGQLIPEVLNSTILAHTFKLIRCIDVVASLVPGIDLILLQDSELQRCFLICISPGK